jgi:hypothetical protein
VASINDVPRDFEQLMKQINRRLISLERRRNGDGVLTLDGDCVFGGGSGGDTSYYGGGTNYPDGTFPPSGWVPGDVGGGGGGSYTAGANIDIVSSTIHFEVVFSEPSSPRVGQLWFDDSA